jgi:hypothetical protein
VSWDSSVTYRCIGQSRAYIRLEVLGEREMDNYEIFSTMSPSTECTHTVQVTEALRAPICMSVRVRDGMVSQPSGSWSGPKME